MKENTMLSNYEATKIIIRLARDTFRAEGKTALDVESRTAIRIHSKEDAAVADAVETLGEANAATVYADQLEELSADAAMREPTSRQANRRLRKSHEEEDGAKYAEEQIQSQYFQDWVRDQLRTASQLPTEDVLPLETKADARVIARNMLQQLEWDARRDLHDKGKDFFKGFSERLRDSSTRDWLADELLEIKGEMGGGRSRVGEARRSSSSRQKYRPSKAWRLHKVDRIVSAPGGGKTVEFIGGLSIQVHSGSGRSDRLYAMRPTDMRYEGNSPGPESRREYQYAALKAVLGDREADFFLDSDGDVTAVLPDGVDAGSIVQDYEAVDSRDRTIAGPFKTYGDAKQHTGAGGHVRFVPKGQRPVAKTARRRSR